MLGADTLPLLHVRRFEHASSRGGSHALVLGTDDGRMAVVKFKGNPQSSRVLVGDLVGTLLGRRVGAPYPEPVLVHVPFDDLLKIPPLRGRRWIPGVQFGTVFRPDAEALGDGAETRSLNLDRLPVAALLELWLHNGDLKADHLLRVRGPSGPELMVVDHGHVFPGGPSWTAIRLQLHADSAPDVGLLTRLAQAASRPFDFSRALAACASVSDGEIERIVETVPAEWGLSGPDAAALRTFLEHRRGLLDGWAEGLKTLWHSRGRPS